MIPRKRLDSSMELYAGTRSRGDPDPWELLREFYEASLFVAPKFGKSNLMNVTRKVNEVLKQHDAERKSDAV